MNWSCNCWPILQPLQRWIQATSLTYTTAHGNARCLTHRARPGIEPTSSWILVGFVTAKPRRELLVLISHFHGIRPWEKLQAVTANDTAVNDDSGAAARPGPRRLMRLNQPPLGLLRTVFLSFTPASASPHEHRLSLEEAFSMSSLFSASLTRLNPFKRCH